MALGEERDWKGDDTHLTTAAVRREPVTPQSTERQQERVLRKGWFHSSLPPDLVSPGAGQHEELFSAARQRSACHRPCSPAVLPAALLAEQHWQRLWLSL